MESGAEIPSYDSVNQSITSPGSTEGSVALDRQSVPANAFLGERVLTFPDADSYEAYLAGLARLELAPITQIDSLRSVRVSRDTLAKLNPDDFGAKSDFSYRVQAPLPPVETNPELLNALRPYALSAYSIAGGAVEGQGQGIVVAIVDSGIEEHALLDATAITEMDFTGDGHQQASHGTAVASIVAGRQGVAPQAELLSVRVLDKNGEGSGFDLAAAIIESVDFGAQIINMSLGVYEDIPVLREAVGYAQAKGVVLVAAAGNDGRGVLPYPAAYSGVLAVTAVDATGRQAIFPNRSKQIDVAAPGVGIEVAAEDGGHSFFSGTSAAAPFISGTLATLMSEGVSGAQAVEILKQHLNDSGAPGVDPLYGAGVMDWGRLRERGIPELHDIAMASVYMDRRGAPGKSSPMLLTVQNRGTSWLPGATLEFTPETGAVQTFSIGSMQPGEIQTREVYVSLPTSSDDVYIFTATASLKDGLVDVHPDNDIERMRFQNRP